MFSSTCSRLPAVQKTPIRIHLASVLVLDLGCDASAGGSAFLFRVLCWWRDVQTSDVDV